MGCSSSSSAGGATNQLIVAQKGMNVKDFASAVKDRRTYYALDKNVKVSESRIREIVEYAITWAPSSFNSQSQRVAILFGAQHDKFWDSTREILRGITPADKFSATNDKMNGFKNGFATVLFFEDQPTIKKLEDGFPSFAAAFQPFSLQSNGMAQYIVWTALEAEGLGCNLQHYSPLVDETIQKQWGVPSSWKLLAQMVVGNPIAQPGDKTFLPIHDRVKFFSSETKQVKSSGSTGKGINVKDFASAVKDRRTIYALDKNVKVSDAKIREIVEYAITWAPSSFNSQSARAIILVGSHHDKFWEGTREILRNITPADKFSSTNDKMNGFKNGYATVLFFEDQAAVKKLEDGFPSFAAAFQPFSLQSNGMAQYIVWAGLETEGLGCSLQHYSPLVDELAQNEWGAPSTWKLLAQMVVGNPIAPAGDKTFLPIQDRVKQYK